MRSKRDRLTKKKVLVVDSECGEMVIESYHHRLAAELGFWYFEDDNVVQENQILNTDEYKQKYGDKKISRLQRYGQHIITPISHTSQTKNNRLCLGISNLSDFHVMVFRLENISVDYGALFDCFEEEVSLLEEEIPLCGELSPKKEE